MLSDLAVFVNASVIILIVVLYVIGLFIKSLNSIPNKFIPCILLVIGIGLSIAILGFTANAIVQGIIVAGIAVFGNELIDNTIVKNFIKK